MQLITEALVQNQQLQPSQPARGCSGQRLASRSTLIGSLVASGATLMLVFRAAADAPAGLSGSALYRTWVSACRPEAAEVRPGYSPADPMRFGKALGRGHVPSAHVDGLCA